MISTPRSGETMVLNALSYHKNCRVLAQLTDKEPKEDKRLFQYLQKSPKNEIDRKYPEDLLLVKNATMAMPRLKLDKAFCLIRNPNAIVYSLVKLGWFDPALEGATGYAENVLTRWCEGIGNKTAKKKSTVNKLFWFLNKRFAEIYYYNTEQLISVWTYEQIVKNPEIIDYYILNSLRLPYEEVSKNIGKHHKGEGHGWNDLNRPIDRKSLDTWKKDDIFVKYAVPKIQENIPEAEKFFFDF